MHYPLLGITLLFALADWLASWHNHHRIRIITKPATLLVLIFWFWQVTGFQQIAFWFGLGLVFSLLGDIFLLFPHRFFLAGLISFLIAHIVYITGFIQQIGLVPADSLSLVGRLVILMLILWPSLRLYQMIMAGLSRKPRQQKLRKGVALYSLAITLMLLSALSTLVCPNWELNSAVLVSLGGLLFYTSDVALAFRRFVNPEHEAYKYLRVTYHLGQIALVLGVSLQLYRPI